MDQITTGRGRKEQAPQLLVLRGACMVAPSLVGSEFNSDRGRKEQAPQLLFLRGVGEVASHKIFDLYCIHA